MVVASWVLSALALAVSAAMSSFRGGGSRIVLVGCVIVGITPIGFIAGATIPLHLPEVLLACLTFMLLVTCNKGCLAVRIPVFVFLYAAYFLLHASKAFYSANLGFLDVIRDIRPVLFIGLLLIVRSALMQTALRFRVSEALLAVGVAICLSADLLYYFAAWAGLLPVAGISGEYLSRTGLVRYADIMTIPVFGVANFMLYSSKRITWATYWLIVCGIVAGTSMSRIYVIGFVVALSWWTSFIVFRAVRMRALSYAAGFVPVLAVALAGILFARSAPDAGEVVSRITETVDMSLLVSALEYRFVEPAIAGGFALTPSTFFFGAGMGFEFYVPWFEYRGLDPWHFSVDSLLAFAFFKYGIIGLVFFCVAVSMFLLIKPWHIANTWVWLYLSVHSGINVPGFLMLLTILVLFRATIWIETDCTRPYPSEKLAHEVLR